MSIYNFEWERFLKTEGLHDEATRIAEKVRSDLWKSVNKTPPERSEIGLDYLGFAPVETDDKYKWQEVINKAKSIGI